MRKPILCTLALAAAALLAQQAALFPVLKSSVRIGKQAGGFWLLTSNQLIRPWGEQTVIPGRPVDPADLPPGCAYAARCPLASTRCLTEDPELVSDAAGRRVACWHAGEPITLEIEDRPLLEHPVEVS